MYRKISFLFFLGTAIACDRSATFEDTSREDVLAAKDPALDAQTANSQGSQSTTMPQTAQPSTPTETFTPTDEMIQSCFYMQKPPNDVDPYVHALNDANSEYGKYLLNHADSEFKNFFQDPTQLVDKTNISKIHVFLPLPLDPYAHEDRFARGYKNAFYKDNQRFYEVDIHVGRSLGANGNHWEFPYVAAAQNNTNPDDQTNSTLEGFEHFLYRARVTFCSGGKRCRLEIAKIGENNVITNEGNLPAADPAICDRPFP